MSSPYPIDPINTDCEFSESDYVSTTSTEKGHRTLTPKIMTEKGFGNPTQQYALKLANALSKFTINTKLKEGGYTLWYRPVYEAIRGLGFHHYLTEEDFKDESISKEDHTQTRFLITTWILGQCEPEEAERARDELSVNNAILEQSDSAYDPYKLWKNLEKHHHEVTEEKLQHIDQALHSFKQHRSDDLRAHVAKFTALLNDFYKFKGEMSTSQAARTLINSLKPGYEVTVKMIYQTVTPLTFLQVKHELLKSQDEEEFQTPSMIQANIATASHASTTEANSSSDRSCTADKCVGNMFKTPHLPKDCFKKPENFDKRDLWISEKEDLRKRKNRKGRGIPSTSHIRGLKKLTRPEASNSMLTFHTSFDFDWPQPSGSEPNIVNNDESDDESYTTAADEVTFNQDSIFEKEIEELSNIVIEAPLLEFSDPMSLEYIFASYHLQCYNVFEDVGPSASNSESFNSKWGLKDTGASHHMFNTISFFVTSSLKRVEDQNKRLKLAGRNATLAVHSTGSVKLKAGDGSVFMLKECLYVPELSRNLIAAGALIKQGVTTILNGDENECFAMIKGDLVLFNGVFCGNLMLLGLEPVSLSDSSISMESQQRANGCDLQHRRLGHLNYNYIKLMSKGNMADGICGSPSPNSPCNVCAKSKSRKLPFSGTRPRATKFLQNVHVDLSGINRVKGLFNEQYYILFCDDYSTYCHIFPLTTKCKEKVFLVFVEYLAAVERQTSQKLRQYTLDNGSEFINTVMDEYCKELGITLHKTAPYTPQQNGVSERMNQTIINMARSMMVQSGVPLNFWYLAVSTAVYIRNRTLTSALNDHKTAYEMWNFRIPTVKHLKVFGCKVHRLIRKELRENKYSQFTSEGVMVGYTEDNYNFQIFDLETKKVIISHDVVFFEDSFPFLKSPPPDADIFPSLEEDPTEDNITRKKGQLSFNREEEDDDETIESPPRESPSRNELNRSDAQPTAPETVENQEENLDAPHQPGAPKRSLRQKEKVNYRGMSVCGAGFESFNILGEEFGTAQVEIDNPKSFKRAMESTDREKWVKACNKEMDSLTSKDVWDLVERPKNKKILRGFWIFKIKPMPQGQPSKFKARFVVMGNLQEEGIDFHETFSPTGKPSSFRLLLALASIHGWEIHQMDAVTAFLNGILDEEIYMEQPEGYKKQGEEHKVCKLNRSLYGLRQSPKIWYDDVVAFLIETGFYQCEIDPCTYIRSNEDKSKITAVYVHVDDMAITGNDIQSFKEEVSKKWQMEDLGLAMTVVGIQITRQSHLSYSINQSALAHDVLKRFEMLEAKPASTPLPAGLKLYRCSDEQVADFARENKNYRSAVGSLMYLSQCTRPDLAYAVGVLSQHLERPGHEQWKAVIHVFRYLKGTINLGIVYSGDDITTVAGQRSFEMPQSHVDADWAGDRNTRRSTTGYIFKLAGGPISWKSRLQPTVALSSTEAEYRAVTEAGQELIWLRNMMNLLGYGDSKPTKLETDNLGAMHLTTKSIFHGRTKHIEIQYHWIREVVSQGDMTVVHCPSTEMMADLLTKSLGKQQFFKLRRMIGLRHSS